jgi:hypothetical protein
MRIIWPSETRYTRKCLHGRIESIGANLSKRKLDFNTYLKKIRPAKKSANQKSCAEFTPIRQRDCRPSARYGILCDIFHFSSVDQFDASGLVERAEEATLEIEVLRQRCHGRFLRWQIERIKVYASARKSIPDLFTNTRVNERAKK